MKCIVAWCVFWSSLHDNGPKGWESNLGQPRGRRVTPTPKDPAVWLYDPTMRPCWRTDYVRLQQPLTPMTINFPETRVVSLREISSRLFTTGYQEVQFLAGFKWRVIKRPLGGIKIDRRRIISQWDDSCWLTQLKDAWRETTSSNEKEDLIKLWPLFGWFC